jgi:hypothetical protein
VNAQILDLIRQTAAAVARHVNWARSVAKAHAAFHAEGEHFFVVIVVSTAKSIQLTVGAVTQSVKLARHVVMASALRQGVQVTSWHATTPVWTQTSIATTVALAALYVMQVKSALLAHVR